MNEQVDMRQRPGFPRAAMRRRLVVTIPIAADVAPEQTADLEAMRGLCALLRESLVDGLQATMKEEENPLLAVHGVSVRYEAERATGQANEWDVLAVAP
jgi:hypothetical protein